MRLAAFTCPSGTWILSDGRCGKNCLLVAKRGIEWEVSSALYAISWRTTSTCFGTTVPPFIFDTVRKAFGLVALDQLVVEPSRVLLENPTLSLQTSQGLVLWAALKA